MSVAALISLVIFRFFSGLAPDYVSVYFACSQVGDGHYSCDGGTY